MNTDKKKQRILRFSWFLLIRVHPCSSVAIFLWGWPGYSRSMLSFRMVLLLVSATLLAGQDVRPKDVREMAKAGSSAIPQLQELLKNPDAEVRIEAVKQITEIRTGSLDALILATRDNDPEVQIRATDGLVNFYLPGYIKTGIGASLRRVGSSIKG